MLALKKINAEAKRKQQQARQNFRLIAPTADNCILCFKPNLDDFTFEGSEIIRMALTDNNTRDITVNASDLIITKVIWEEDVTLNRQEPSEILFEERGILKLIFEPPLFENTGVLRINFKGSLTEKRVAGFYVFSGEPSQQLEESVFSPQLTQQKNQLSMVAKFDPCHARRCFPSWDDPAIKLSYDIILVVPKNSTVVGPTLIKARYPHRRDPNLEIVEFKTTPKLSTHALGFGFGTIENLSRRILEDEMQIRIYTPPGKRAGAEYALDFTCKAVTFFTEYFGTQLGSQKLDLVALPDCINSPIEGWGLIFFRMSDVLVDSATSKSDLLRVSLVLCNEVAKQWFGSLTTHEWWNHQWLKVGLAIFSKYIFVNTMFPDMDIWTLFVTQIFQKGLRMDATRISHAIDMSLVSVAEIEDAVDEISMQKAPSLVRMAHRYVGDTSFRKGVAIYLDRYRFGNATSADFWKCLQDACSKPVGTIMTSWSTIRGYPVITVVGRHEGRHWNLKLSQERFVYEQMNRDVKGLPQNWVIPLTFSTRNYPTSSVLDVLMENKTTSVTINEVLKTDWVKLNPGSIGFFRVRYPPDLYALLVAAIRDKSLPPLDRLNILDDCFAFLLAGLGPTMEVVTLLEAFVNEDDLSVWTSISSIFDKFLRVFDHIQKAESFMAFGRCLYSKIFGKLGWAGYDSKQQQLRSLIVLMMAKFGNQEVIEECRNLFEGQLGDEAVSIPVDLRKSVYEAVVMHGDDNAVKRCMRLYRDSDYAEEKIQLASAIGASRVTTQFQHILEFAISEEVLRVHAIHLLTTLAKTRVGKDYVWAFFKENFSVFKTKFTVPQLDTLLRAVLEDFVSEERATDIQEFFKSNPFPGTEWAVQQIVESIRLNEMWLLREKNLAGLAEYLESRENKI